MKRAVILLILFTTIRSLNILNAQERKIRIGAEPFYNYLFYQRDFQDYEKVSRHLTGIGFAVETPLSKSNDRWALNTGLYYHFICSSTMDKYAVDYPNCQLTTTIKIYNYLKVESSFKSHNLRLPIQLVYHIKRFSIYGGMLLDYEIRNRCHLERELDPQSSCVNPETSWSVYNESWTGEMGNNKFSYGVEVRLGYSFELAKGCEIRPGLNYNFMLKPYRSAIHSGRYMEKRHGIGIGCTVFF